MKLKSLFFNDLTIVRQVVAHEMEILWDFLVNYGQDGVNQRTYYHQKRRHQQ